MYMEIEDFRKKLTELRKVVAFSEYCDPERKSQVLGEAWRKSDMLAFDIEIAWMKAVETYNNNEWRELFYEASEFMSNTMLKSEEASEVVRKIRLANLRPYVIRRNPR